MRTKKQIIISLTILSMLILGTVGCNPSSTAIPTTGLAVSVQTSQTSNAWYAPRHVMAIWIETSTGVFVKSLTVKAQQRIGYLVRWDQSSAGNTTDAVTGATISSHGTINAYWNGKNKNGTIVPDGTYLVCMELTDYDGTGNFASFSFTKGVAAQTLTPANKPSFSAISLKWMPL
jgi:hypothetical protein